MENTRFNEAIDYLNDVYRVAFYLMKSQEEAEDLVQEVYLKAYSNWDKFTPGTNCKAWLFKILNNTRINYLKKESRKPIALPPETIESLQMEAPAVGLKEHIQAALSDEIKNALSKVPDEYADAMVLNWAGDFSYAEIAEILDCPIGTVMSRIYRGRALLRKYLGDYWKVK